MIISGISRRIAQKDEPNQQPRPLRARGKRAGGAY
jgi:hypothetical protein